MGSLNASLAWSVPVKADILTAHLQAYVDMHEGAIKTLRLCHQFGRGEDIPLQRLPVELVGRIEDYLMEDRRHAYRILHAWDFRCWKGTCKPHEHLDPIDGADMYLELCDDQYDCEQCGCTVLSPTGPCKGGHNCGDSNEGHALRTEQNELLDQSLFDEQIDAQECHWWEVHHDRAESWQSKISGDGQYDHGIFEKHVELFYNHFRLIIWDSHTQRNPKDDEEFMRTNGVCASTIAYLTLPSANLIAEFEQEYDDRADRHVGESLPLHTQSGYGVDVAMPSPLSPEQLRLFMRAFRILGLSARQDHPTGQLMCATWRDPDSCTAEFEWSGGAADEKLSESCVPKLRLLVSASVGEG